MTRAVVLDTETTGFDAERDRIVEIGGIELDDGVPTGTTFHRYLNPERDVPDGAQRVHGITVGFLACMPTFAQVAGDLLEFIGEAPIIAHNAPFDMRFLNAELRRSKREAIPSARAIDTIEIAKKKHPGGRYSLDELCRRLNIDSATRTKHGALVDAELTAKLYGELTGALRPAMALEVTTAAAPVVSEIHVPAMQRPEPLPARISPEEEAAHAAFVANELGKEPIWTGIA